MAAQEGAPVVDDAPVENSVAASPSKEGCDSHTVETSRDEANSSSDNNQEDTRTVSTQGTTKDGDNVNHNEKDISTEEVAKEERPVPVLNVSSIDQAQSVEDSEISVGSKGNSYQEGEYPEENLPMKEQHVEEREVQHSNKPDDQEETTDPPTTTSNEKDVEEAIMEAENHESAMTTTNEADGEEPITEPVVRTDSEQPTTVDASNQVDAVEVADTMSTAEDGTTGAGDVVTGEEEATDQLSEGSEKEAPLNNPAISVSEQMDLASPPTEDETPKLENDHAATLVEDEPDSAPSNDLAEEVQDGETPDEFGTDVVAATSMDVPNHEHDNPKPATVEEIVPTTSETEQVAAHVVETDVTIGHSLPTAGPAAARVGTDDDDAEDGVAEPGTGGASVNVTVVSDDDSVEVEGNFDDEDVQNTESSPWQEDKENEENEMSSTTSKNEKKYQQDPPETGKNNDNEESAGEPKEIPSEEEPKVETKPPTTETPPTIIKNDDLQLQTSNSDTNMEKITTEASADDSPPVKKMDVKQREESLKATLTKPTSKAGPVKKMDVKQREESLKATVTKTTSQAAAVNKIDIKQREESLKASLIKQSSQPATTAGKMDIQQREASLKATAAQKPTPIPPPPPKKLNHTAQSNRRSSEGSFGNRYKNGLVPGLSLETETHSFQSVKNQIAAYNDKCQLKAVVPGKEAKELSELKARKRRASTGELVRPKQVTTSAKSIPASVVSPPRSTSNKSLLMTYNKDLYYANEMNKLLNVDPADLSKSQKLAFDDILKIVKDCPSVCRAKYDLTFCSEKRNLYPLFSLVANAAPLELIETVFMENPFRFIDVCDDRGQTIMHYACAFHPLPNETLDFLIHRCPQSLAAWDEKKRSPLHVACLNMSSATETCIHVLEQSPAHVVVTPDSEGKLPLDLATMNKKCSSKLKQRLIARAEGAVPEPEKKEKPTPELVIGKYSASAPAGAAKTTTTTTTPGSLPKDTRPPEPELPKPSFWDLLCCRPVSW
ncbi:expressed unknown protein [Seminavis robusta]|uniref:Uncharacterized protein n=1 Tax=Seminavis robusta TaxID=568900 RepID=A0A9N8HKX0_9STRA|nr:expressed unknown protein [Seminavis robusta]|eukprot:Sro980_g227350.1 n/a (1005) ;mRNA; r:5312-8475